jgi:hypothetical protein
MFDAGGKVMTEKNPYFFLSLLLFLLLTITSNTLNLANTPVSLPLNQCSPCAPHPHPVSEAHPWPCFREGLSAHWLVGWTASSHLLSFLLRAGVYVLARKSHL